MLSCLNKRQSISIWRKVGAFFVARNRVKGGVRIVRAYGKSWDYNVYSCKYCLYWKGERTGCIYPKGCCCPIPQKPKMRFGTEIHYPSSEKQTVAQSDCDNCPYGRDSPCIGWCTKEVMKAVGLPRERNL